MAEKKVKFDIENGQAFFADEAGVIHNPMRIILDFRSITPRIDVRNQEYQPLVLRHNVVMMDPYTAKSLLEALKKNIQGYENQFGKITKPEPIKVMEKKKGKKSTKATDKKAPNYFG